MYIYIYIHYNSDILDYSGYICIYIYIEYKFIHAHTHTWLGELTMVQTIPPPPRSCDKYPGMWMNISISTSCFDVNTRFPRVLIHSHFGRRGSCPEPQKVQYWSRQKAFPSPTCQYWFWPQKQLDIQWLNEFLQLPLDIFIRGARGQLA